MDLDFPPEISLSLFCVPDAENLKRLSVTGP